MEKSEKLDEFPLLTKVTEDIYKLSVQYPFGMRQANSYLFKGETGFTVMDTGSHANESIDIWEQTLSNGLKIEKILITHVHPDHIGLAGWFQKNYRVPVFISDIGYKEIQKRAQESDYGNNKINLIKQHGGPEIPEELMIPEVNTYDFRPDGLFENKQQIKLGNDIYETILTPGHSVDHFCFYNSEKKLMVIGDHVMDKITPTISAWSYENDFNPLKYYFESLDLVNGYPTLLALPGHGEPFTNMSKRIEEIKSRHKERMAQILESIKYEEKTAGKINQEIYGNLNIYKFYQPLMSTITRLAYLESEGKVFCMVKNGKSYYRSAI